MKLIRLVLFFIYLFLPVADVMGDESASFEGIIEPSEKINLCSPVQGTLESVEVERGDRITKGQIVARLNSRVEEAAVELARARVEFAKRKVLRNEDLYQKELISNHDKDEMETELRVAELQLRDVMERLDLRRIRSTAEGVVVERFLSPGEYVGQEPILKIARTHPLYVEVVMPASKFGAIRRGMTARIKPELPVGDKLLARVKIVDSVIDAASGTFGVRLELPNPDLRLPAGMRCKVFFNPP